MCIVCVVLILSAIIAPAIFQNPAHSQTEQTTPTRTASNQNPTNLLGTGLPLKYGDPIAGAIAVIIIAGVSLLLYSKRKQKRRENRTAMFRPQN